jgi:peptide deformylase
MPSSDLSLVGLDDMPEPPYSTPTSDPLVLYATAKKMEHLCERLGGVGLAAAQVGVPWRLFVALDEYPSSEKDFGIFFDCSYEPDSSESFPSVEGCLSLPGKQYKVSRYERVLVKGHRILESADGVYCESFSAVYSGVPAVIMQHEIDHDHGRERMIDSIGNAVSIAWR